MYTPAAFAEADTARLHDFIRRHGFATLVTHGEGGMVASHLPLLLDARRRAAGPPARATWPGPTRSGGRSRARRWPSSTGRTPTSLPSWYEEHGGRSRPGTTSPSTPTAPSTLVEGRDGLLDILRRSVAAYEGPRPEPWTFDESEPHVEGLLKAIVGFRIEITRLEGKWKLSQNHPEERRRKVIRALEAGPTTTRGRSPG